MVAVYISSFNTQNDVMCLAYPWITNCINDKEVLLYHKSQKFHRLKIFVDSSIQRKLN